MSDIGPLESPTGRPAKVWTQQEKADLKAAFEVIADREAGQSAMKFDQEEIDKIYKRAKRAANISMFFATVAMVCYGIIFVYYITQIISR